MLFWAVINYGAIVVMSNSLKKVRVRFTLAAKLFILGVMIAFMSSVYWLLDLIGAYA